MFMEERHEEIIGKINTEGKITIKFITEKYGVSDESARRDLRLLEQKGLCKRTHGGAIKLQQVSVWPPKNRNFEKMTIFPNYKAIAQKAIEHIKENDIIYVTSGSFGYIMVSMLPENFHYTVIVNSVDLGKELRRFGNIDVYVVGGKMRQSGSLVDSLAVEFISKIHFDKCFITGSGLTSEFGLSNGSDETASFQRTIIKNSRKKYLLLPGNKIGVNSFIKVCEADEFDAIITDWECVEDDIVSLEEKAIEIIVAEEEYGSGNKTEKHDS